MSHLLRIELPDVPGSLGAVASALGHAGANILAIEVVEPGADGAPAIDDVFVELPGAVMPDVVVSAVQRLGGVRVQWVSRYAAAGSLQLDLEIVERVTEKPDRAVQTLAELLPRAFRADWSVVATHEGDQVVTLHASPGASPVPPEARAWFPATRPARLDAPPQAAGWSAMVVAGAPLGGADRLVAFGRHGGPDVLDSELARLGHLAALTASIERSLPGDTG